MNHYMIFVNCGNMVANQFIVTDVNLLEMYKAALMSGAKQVTWEKGVLDLTSIVGIVDNAPPPPLPPRPGVKP